MNRTVLRHFPKSRLAVLAARSGGVSSDDAIAAATQNIERMRRQSDEVLTQTITALEMLLEAFRGDPPSDVALARLRIDSDRLVSLSGMFGLESLNRVARSLCDLLAALTTAKLRDSSGIAVHLRALRLSLPGAPPMTPAAEERIFGELEKLVRHYDR